MRQRCEEHLSQMLVGNEAVCPDAMESWVILLTGDTFGPYVASAATTFHRSVRSLNHSVARGASDKEIAHLRDAALASLGVLVELKNAELAW